MHFGFITFEGMPALYEDELHVTGELERRGHRVTPVQWTAPLPADVDVFVMRNPWDWFQRRDEFRTFLKSLRGRRVLNSPDVLEAFADKTYLPRLEAKGVAVVPTVQLSPDQLHRVPELLKEKHWLRAVLKPSFTANAVGAYRFDAGDAERVVGEILSGPASREIHLLQPYVEGIETEEKSFVFFGGVFSHAVRKTPKAGEWRVQNAYGGVPVKFEPVASEVAQAKAILDGAGVETAYARVDVVQWNGSLHLMELELVEPELFFRLHPPAAARFADVLESGSMK